MTIVTFCNVTTGQVYDFCDRHVGFGTTEDSRVQSSPAAVDGLHNLSITQEAQDDPLVNIARGYFKGVEVKVSSEGGDSNGNFNR